MPERKSPKSKKWIILIIILAVLVLGAGGGVAYYLLNPIYIITGKATDTDNGKPVKGLKVEADKQESITGDNGIYELKNVNKNTVVNFIAPSKYKQIDSQMNYNEYERVNIHTRKITEDVKLDPTEEETIKRTKEGAIITLNEKNFEKEVLKNKKTVLVDFWAPWCDPCQKLGPIIEEIAREFKDKIVISEVNVDENQALTSKYKVDFFPTILIFKNGEIVEHIAGLQTKDFLINKLNSLH